MFAGTKVRICSVQGPDPKLFDLTLHMEFCFSDLSLSEHTTISGIILGPKYLDGVKMITLRNRRSLGHGYALNPFYLEAPEEIQLSLALYSPAD